MANNNLKEITARAKAIREAGGKISHSCEAYKVDWKTALKQAADEYNRKKKSISDNIIGEEWAVRPPAKAQPSAKSASSTPPKPATKARPARSKTTAQKTERTELKRANTAAEMSSFAEKKLAIKKVKKFRRLVACLPDGEIDNFLKNKAHCRNGSPYLIALFHSDGSL